MTASLRQAAGSLLVAGLGGTELTGLERAWLRLVRPAGVILFRRNIVDAAQTQALLSEASGLCGAHSFRCVDVEGGTVDRLRDALAPMPSAQAVARAGRRTSELEKCGEDSRFPRSQKRDLGHPGPDRGLGFAVSHPFRDEAAERMGHPTIGAHPAGSTLVPTRPNAQESRLAREHGELVARAVRAFGFNTTLAPVLDLGLPVSAEVMGTRTSAATAAGVVDYARAFLAGLAAQGVVGCGKHFPGLGGGTLDSHLQTPRIERSGNELWREDLAPYRVLRDELPMIMVNHAAYPQTPGKELPASISPYWITTVLRRRIGYRGIAFSDDMEMGGILKFMPMEEAAVAAVRAGMDLIEICHSPEFILRAYEALIAEGERFVAFRRLLLERAQRTARARAKLFRNGNPKALTARQFESLRGRILRFKERVEKAQPVTTEETQSA